MFLVVFAESTVLSLKTNGDPHAGGRAGSQWEAPTEGSRKSRKEGATEENFGKPLDALDGLNDREALLSRA